MQGFKSFAKRTEIPFDQGINVIVGPNGAGKSNISDSLCFVLGRLSIKSLRAAKAKNLIFMGSKYIKPSHEASVEIIFDNSDRTFNIDRDEITIKRIVRLNGQSIYKLNGETKTRAEVIEALAQSGIDPYGFNIILKGEIQSIVKMHAEERREIIEEVAGISIYESRKEKSLRELEKTEERLKEISTILRERTAILNNLEKEKAQAQKYQDLKNVVKRAKASITQKKLDEKKREIDSFVKSINEKTGERDKKREKAEQIQDDIDKLTEKINEINKHIRQATGLEQGRLREEITNLRAELEGLRVRREGYEHRKEEIERRIQEMKKSIPEFENEIKELKEKSPMMAKKAEDLKKKREELAELERERKKILTLKSELFSIMERILDKQKQLARISADSESFMEQIDRMADNLSYKDLEECKKSLHSLLEKVKEKRELINKLRNEEVEHEKLISIARMEILQGEETREKVKKIDVCPLCQSKMTASHIGHVFKSSDEKISAGKKKQEIAEINLEKIRGRFKEERKEIDELEKKIENARNEKGLHENSLRIKESIKKSVEYEKVLRGELKELEMNKISLENKSVSSEKIEENYHSKLLEIEEISSRTEEDIDTTLLYKERELEKTKSIIERSEFDLEDITKQIEELGDNAEKKMERLEEKEEQERKLNEKFEKMFKQRDDWQKEIQELSMKQNEMQNGARELEEQVNYFRVGRAKVEGERETLEVDMQEYAGVELIPGSIVFLEEKLNKAQQSLEVIGSINLRALEVYDEVRKEYELVKEKVDVLDKEKLEILKIIEEIDKKKKLTFMKTFRAINELFSRNFSKLTTKTASAYLEIENKENIFEGGINIIVKMAKGKYFDVTSLSGGEQTLVALSLLFAIQEYRPYQFYILDEIDAALDKRNSERLAALLNQYMQSGQYIVISHNDAIILNSQVLYGISMHDGISKVLSLKIAKENQGAKEETEKKE